MSTRPPFIAVASYHLPQEKIVGWPAGGYAVPEKYVECLARAGASSALLPIQDSDPLELLGPFDGLLLPGGGDIDPSRSGAGDHPAVYGVDGERDRFEVALLAAAIELGRPVLAICRGMQLMNVAFGGTLHAHLPDVPGLLVHGDPGEGRSSFHPVEVEPSSRLQEVFGEARIDACLSWHHQGVDRVGTGLRSVGTTSDGLVEALEVASDDAWVVGVQWHPEGTAADDPTQQRLFDALVARSRR